MSDEMHFRIGLHEADINALKEEVRLLRAEVVEIKEMISGMKGGIRLLVAVASVAGALGAGLVKVLAFLKGGQT